MKLPSLLTLVAATLPMTTLADFDLWESTAAFVGPYDTTVTLTEVTHFHTHPLLLWPTLNASLNLLNYNHGALHSLISAHTHFSFGQH